MVSAASFAVGLQWIGTQKSQRYPCPNITYVGQFLGNSFSGHYIFFVIQCMSRHALGKPIMYVYLRGRSLHENSGVVIFGVITYRLCNEAGTIT